MYGIFGRDSRCTVIHGMHACTALANPKGTVHICCQKWCVHSLEVYVSAYVHTYIHTYICIHTFLHTYAYMFLLVSSLLIKQMQEMYERKVSIRQHSSGLKLQLKMI